MTHDRLYPNYVLAILVLVYVFNFLDRQILSILNEQIKADLELNDAQMGFLYGTAFAVFYAVLGIPLGRLADVWSRRSVIAIGLTLWSLLTTLSGLARNFTHLGMARFGVGVGEASASPAAFSMLSDYFPARRRATVLAIYSSGIYLGAGAGLLLGGQVVDRWNAAFAGSAAPLGLRGWQVAFFVAGIPGLLLALWVRTLRDPRRDKTDVTGDPTPAPGDGIALTAESRPFRHFLTELRGVIPPLTLWNLRILGGGRTAIGRNLAAALLFVTIAVLLTRLTGDAAQWTALAIGWYATFSWGQSVGLRDPVSARLILRTPSLTLGCLGFGCIAFVTYGTGYWMPPFLMRFHGASAASVGTVYGVSAAIAGSIGITVGGILADHWRRHASAGRLYLAMVSALVAVGSILLILISKSLTWAYLINVVAIGCSAMWIGVGASTVQDLVLPRMRGLASGVYLLVITLVGLALGPYTIGKLSVKLADLRAAMMIGSGVAIVGCLLLLVAGRHLPRDEATLLERARQAGDLT